MTPQHSSSDGEIDALLASLPERLTKNFGPYQVGPGYKCWKVGCRNWVQWNDLGPAKRKHIPNVRGAMRTWEIFARFGRHPGAPWDKPEKYALDWKWMPAGDDVWGCTRESLRAYQGGVSDLEKRLTGDLKAARDYSLAQYELK